MAVEVCRAYIRAKSILKNKDANVKQKFRMAMVLFFWQQKICVGLV